MKVILPLAALLAFAVLAGFSNAYCYPECFPNNPPIIAGLPDQTVMVGQSTPLWDLYTYASDTEDYYTDLMFSIDYQSNPSVISCYITGNRYVGCGAGQSIGFSDITVRVTDTGGLSSVDSFRITVQGLPPVNTPPMISGIPDYTINAGQSIPSIDLFGYAFDQQDSDSALAFSIDSQSDGSVISCSIASNRYVQCGASQKAGFSDIIVRVTDTGGLSDTDSFRITVQGSSPVNTPPVISGIPDLAINPGQTISLVDLFAYASDSQDPDSALAFGIDSQSNPGAINCYITGNRYVGCGAGQSIGFSDITVRVTDTGGLSSVDSFRITVQSQPPAGDHAPVISSLSITPSSPEDTDTLACTAQVSDQDGNLQSVQFRWLVNGGLDRTRTIQVSGSSSTAQDTLDSSRSGLGDEVKCEATAYDSMGLQDSDFDAVVIQRQDCGTDVLNLEIIDNNKIRFRIRNTGNSQQDINYKVYVDGAIVGESSVTLNSGELEIIQNSHSFGIGSFIVKVKATAQCGSTDSETIVHEVLDPCPEPSCPGPQPGNEDPVVDSVRITPSSPEEGDELTCRVELSDNEGDLDRVQLKWLVEGDLERTRTIYVSGSHDDVEDTLTSSWFNSGDEVRCEARVFDEDGNEDSDSDVVTIGGEQGCGVDVYNLEMISNNEIRFRIRNTGQDTQSINYKVYVESEVIIEHSISLDEDEWDSIEETFSFDASDSIIKVKARAECGSTDTEFLSFEGDHGICTARYLDEYRCSGSWSQRKYQYSDCSTVWVNYESCSSGCSNGFCTGTGGQCAVSIQKFDYQTSIVAGNAAYVTLEARNTASRQETITLSLWVDGQLKESYPSFVNSGSTSLRTFYYYPSAGTHQILAKAETNCGTSDTRTATVNVLQTGQPTPYPYPYPTPPAPSLPTAVSIYPSSVDTCLCDAKFITINIHNSVEQVYTIQVTGVPSEWVSYQSQTIVKSGDRQLFVYAAPKELGTHNMRIRVTAETEKKSFEQDVSVFTAPCPEQPQPDSITGSLIEAAKSPLFWIALIIIAGAIVIFVGATRLKPDEEFYEPVYPYRTYRPVSKNQK